MGGRISEKLKDKCLQQRQGLLENQIPLYQKVLSFFSLYSMFLLLGTTPLGVQRFVVHSLQPFAVAGLVRLFATVIKHPWLSFIPLILFLYIFTRYLYNNHKKAIRQQSKIFSMQQTSGINYLRKSGIEFTSSKVDEDVEAPTPVDGTVSLNLTITQCDPEVLLNGKDTDEQLPGDEIRQPSVLQSLENNNDPPDDRRDILSSSPRSKSPRHISPKSRPVYRGMFSLPDDEEDKELDRVKSRTKERRASRSRRESHDHRRDSKDHRRFSGFQKLSQRTYSRLLRMISINDEEEKKNEEQFDNPEELSDFDSFSSDGSHMDYSSGSDSHSEIDSADISTDEER